MQAQEVLDFWFSRPKAWFEKNPAFDAEIRSRFLSLFEVAVSGKIEQWKNQPASCLALVIVLDQFPRNMFRGSARAFAGDAMGLDTARFAVARKYDESFSKDQKTFLYLPFEHSESLADQESCCKLMAPLGDDLLQWAERHRAIVARFGRFPHRNAALGRASTPEEIEFLKQPGSGF